jgi:hypothetical protein
MGSKPPRTCRLSARSIPEIVAAVEGVVVRIGDRCTLTFRGGKFSKDAFLNALAAYVLDQPPDEQERLLSEGLSRYEAMLDRAPDGNGHGPGAAANASRGQDSRPFHLPDPPTIPTEQPAPFSLPLPGEWVRVEARPGRVPPLTRPRRGDGLGRDLRAARGGGPPLPG